MKKKFSPVFLYVSIWRKSKYYMNIRWLSSMFDLSTITSELTSAHIKLWFALLSSSIALNCAGWIILPAPNTLLIGVLTTSDHTWYLSHSKSIRQSTTVHGRSMCPLTTQYNANVKYCHKWWRQKQPLIFKVSGIKVYLFIVYVCRDTHINQRKLSPPSGWMWTLRVSELSMVCLALVVTCPALPGV